MPIPWFIGGILLGTGLTFFVLHMRGGLSWPPRGVGSVRELVLTGSLAAGFAATAVTAILMFVERAL